MPTPTQNLGLKKHDYQEQGWHTGLNESLDILDAEVQALKTGKAGAVHRHPASEVDGLLEAFASKADAGHRHPVDQVAGLPEALAAIQAAVALKADLGADGKLLSALLPSLAVVNTWPAASAEEMLAIKANPGDFALRLDLPPDSRAYILAQLPAADPLNWIRVETPEAPHTVDQIVGLAEALAAKADLALLGRKAIPVVTAELLPNATAFVQAPLGKAYQLLQVATKTPARVRVYSTAAYRAADAARPSTQDPVAPAGVVLDLVTAAGQLAWPLEPPFPTGANLEPAPTPDAFLAIANLDAAPRAVSIDFLILSLEQ